MTGDRAGTASTYKPSTEFISYLGEERDQQIRIAALDAAARYHAGTGAGPYMVTADAALFAKFIKTGATR